VKPAPIRHAPHGSISIMGEAVPASTYVSAPSDSVSAVPSEKIENSDHVNLIILACHSFAAEARAELVNSKGLSGRVLPGSARRPPVAEDLLEGQSTGRARAAGSAGRRHVAIVWAGFCGLGLGKRF